MPDLDDVLSAAEGARATSFAGAQIPDDTVVALAGVVRARRARRRAVQAVVAVPVAALLGAGAWLALGHDQAPVPPVTQEPGPTHSSTPPPSPTRTPTSTPTSSATPSETEQPLVALPGEPGLPPRYEAPADILAESGPGWVLAVYELTTTESGPPTDVVVLTSPDGTTYELMRTDPATSPWASIRLVDWQAGEATALVNAAWVGQGSPTSGGQAALRLDLRSGEITAGPATWDGRLVLGEDSSQHLTVTGPTGMVTTAAQRIDTPQVSPTQRYVLSGWSVVDATTGDLVTSFDAQRADGWCEPVSWWTADTILARCLDHSNQWSGSVLDAHPRLVAIPVTAPPSQAGTLVRALRAGDPDPWEWGATWVSDGRVVAQGNLLTPDSRVGAEIPQADGVYLLDASGATTLDTTDAEAWMYFAQAVGGEVVVDAESDSATLVSFDLSTGAATVLLPHSAPYPGDANRYSGPVSWLLAG